MGMWVSFLLASTLGLVTMITAFLLSSILGPVLMTVAAILSRMRSERLIKGL